MIPQVVIVDTEKQGKKFLQESLDKSKQLVKLFPEGDRWKIEQVRALRQRLSRVLNEKAQIILWWFDTAGVEAQNASLKMLEAFSLKYDFYLIVENPNKLLPTILSRVVVRDLRERKVIKDIADFSLDKLEFKDIKTKEEAEEVLKNLLFYFWKKAKEENDQRAAIVGKKILEMLQLLTANNLNPQLTVDYCLIFIFNKVIIKK